MNKFLIFVLSFALSTGALASLQTASFRTQTGQIVKVGDPLVDMAKRLGQSPNSVQSQLWTENETQLPALKYTYQINNIIYVITVSDNLVKKIEYERLAQ